MVSLPLEAESNSKRGFSISTIGKIGISLAFLAFVALSKSQFFGNDSESQLKAKCYQPDYYRPENYEENKDLLFKIINDETFRNQSVVKMQKAIQIDTSSNDAEPADVGSHLEEFKRFEVFESFLQETFPLFYEKTELHKVNYHGLVYIWKGSDESLKPLLLMAHQDVVPINEKSLSEWVHPPFRADYDGKYIYGRGAGDCKDLLIGQIEGAEELIKNGFEPKRTVIFSYGFDEEVNGMRNENAKYIEEIYGPNSLYAVWDEGGVSLVDIEDVTLAVVGTGEKGFLNVIVSIQKTGGHSSVPQDHTAIGFMGQVIVEVENNKFPTYFVESNPTFWEYTCLAEKSIDIDDILKKDILNSQSDEASNKRVRDFINQDRLNSYAIKTTQALDIIYGGVKANALPEYVELTINSRVALEESIDIAYQKFVTDVFNVAKKNELGFTVMYPNGTETVLLEDINSLGMFKIEPSMMLEPSKITSNSDKKWDIFAGTARHVYEELAYPNEFNEETGKTVVVTPGLGTGNTDTKLYWNLTDTIYRYRPGVLPSVTANSHGINEYIDFDSHLQIIAFVFEYIQSVDSASD